MICLTCNRTYTFETVKKISCKEVLGNYYTYHCPFCNSKVVMLSDSLPKGEFKEIDARHIC